MRVNKEQVLDPHTAPAIFESVICAYLNCNNHIEYTPSLVHICAPFVITMDTEFDVYSCFERVANAICNTTSSQQQRAHINQRVAQFLSYFRTLMPELYNYFEEEELDVGEWAASWLRYLLAKELPIQSVLALWDVYFSMPDYIEFHPFVCLAILRHFKDSLEDLEQSEIRSMLLRLPKMNISRIASQAYNIQSEIQARYVASPPSRNNLYMK